MFSKIKGFPLKGNQRGFTLVELMVVVAIIGLLAAVAIPNFKKFQAKTKTSEAKLQLAALYTAETSFNGDYDTYATCLSDMGYDPSLDIKTRYYATGFELAEVGGNAQAITNGAPACTIGANKSAFSAGKSVGNKIAVNTDVVSANCGASQPEVNDAAGTEGSVFLACAIGPVDSAKATSPSADWSAFTVDQNKTLKKIRDGF